MSRNSAQKAPDTPSQILRLLEQEYPSAQSVTITETSKSWIYITAQFVFKLKKQVRDDLQDLTSLRARHDNTLTEIDLNRRLAPQIYLGAIRVAENADGGLCLGGPGHTRDWLVKMKRLPASRMLDVLMAKHETEPAVMLPVMDRLTTELVAFYRDAPATNLRAEELTTILQDQQEMNRATLLHPQFAALHARFNVVFTAYETMFDRFFSQLVTRAEAGWIRECHGDLRPEHICLSDPPVVFDCLEFNRNLRLVDPFSEIMFLGLECDLLGAEWIKPYLIKALETGLQNWPDPELLRFYEVIHALLRARLCLAHLLVPKPRKPKKWMPLGLRYLEVAERALL
ncbi:Aminoglycoside phosphotransferase family enzyme [Puniceibacterium sediminis]|uniref:Aminoglycoside phosphotransferase family enzyme n=2 Tax=Puniceibacterium sediminis TaxID=1608407 RepID=A0A238ZF76_9RHOB|nr:Aminoglycoside phosphotransferase family enzyme [Puniceibacterium sediminis]